MLPETALTLRTPVTAPFINDRVNNFVKNCKTAAKTLSNVPENNNYTAKPIETAKVFRVLA